MSISSRYQRIQSVVDNHIERGHFSGVEWLVMRGGKEWSRGRAGQADALNNREMAEKPLYRIYSMTKPVVSAVALMLVEQGRLRLFDPVAAYLPDFAEMSVFSADGKAAPAQNPMIIEHLLTHRAGLSYGFIRGCPTGEAYRDTSINDASMSLADLAETVAAIPLAFEPGSQWRYSVATDVLARILEVVLKRPLADILRDFVLAPLSMWDTGFSVTQENQHRLMAPFGKSDLNELMNFDDQPQTLIPANLDEQHPTSQSGFCRGGYGLYSTLEDYASFTSFLATGFSSTGERLLSGKMLELMWTNRIPENQLPLAIGPLVLPGYGFGLAGRVMINQGAALGLTSLGECGWAGAASTYFWIDREEDIIGITMAQYLGSKIPIGDDIRNAVYQALDD